MVGVLYFFFLFAFAVDELFLYILILIIQFLLSNRCHPCDKLKPVIETMVRDRNGQILLAYLDVDSNAAVSKKYDVVAVPTVIGLFNGSVADKFVGTSSPELIEEFMQRLLELADGKNAEIKKK